MKSFLIALGLFVYALPSWSMNKTGRLGVGMTNHLINDIPALSIKIQQNRFYAIGGFLGFRSSEDATTYGAGLKVYRVIFEEEFLNFYLAGSLATLSFEEDKKAESGHQFDGLFGTEFHLQGVESIGFSFELGVSMNKGPEGQRFETLGNNFLKAAVHFYL